MIFDQTVDQLSLAPGNAPLNERLINLLDASRAKLLRQSRGSLARAGKNDHSADRTIEPMHHADEDVARLLVLRAQIVADLVDERNVPRAIAGRE